MSPTFKYILHLKYACYMNSHNLIKHSNYNRKLTTTTNGCFMNVLLGLNSYNIIRKIIAYSKPDENQLAGNTKYCLQLLSLILFSVSHWTFYLSTTAINYTKHRLTKIVEMTLYTGKQITSGHKAKKNQMSTRSVQGCPVVIIYS